MCSMYALSRLGFPYSWYLEEYGAFVYPPLLPTNQSFGLFLSRHFYSFSLSSPVLVYFLSLSFATAFNTSPGVNCVSRPVVYLFVFAFSPGYVLSPSCAPKCAPPSFPFSIPSTLLSLFTFLFSLSLSSNALCCMCILSFSSLYPSQNSQTSDPTFTLFCHRDFLR
jgi:hypothetical protein